MKSINNMDAKLSATAAKVAKVAKTKEAKETGDRSFYEKAKKAISRRSDEAAQEEGRKYTNLAKSKAVKTDENNFKDNKDEVFKKLIN